MKNVLGIISLVGISSFLSAQQPQPGLAESKMEALELKSADEGEQLLYRQYRPEDLEEGKTVPLIIFLHGYGERGDDNKKQLVHCADEIVKFIEETNNPAFFIMPQCQKDMRWVRYHKPLKNPPHRMDRYPTLPLQMVEKLIEEKIKELPIDPKKIYIAGLSMGGFATWELISRRPDLFAAAIPICGGGDPDQAEKFKDIPIWVFHGSADSVVPPAYSTLVIQALKKANAPEVKYTEYPEVGHNSWTQTLQNPKVLQWLFQQSK